MPGEFLPPWDIGVRSTMIITGVTRTNAKGNPEDQFVIGCEDHSYWYKGIPPLTNGCRSCWEAYFIGQWCQAGGKPEQVDQLEEAIRHSAELADKGLWDFKPGYDVKIDKDVN